jgi:hypothetical protein
MNSPTRFANVGRDNSALDRRQFLKRSSVAAAVLMFQPWRLLADGSLPKNSYSLVPTGPTLDLASSTIGAARFTYSGTHLKLEADRVVEPGRTITMADLGNPQPQNSLRLAKVTPMTEVLWRLALENIESALVEFEGVKYFAAGSTWGIRVYTRDIAFSGVLGVNRLYPHEMLSSLRETRKVHRTLCFRVSQDHAAFAIPAPWIVENLNEGKFLEKYRTNSYTRRTDDVVWLWCAEDLFLGNPGLADWSWLYDEGKWFFENMYAPFFDPKDGMYRGQAVFVDIGGNGYPMHTPAFTSQTDCVLIKALSLNCLYVRGLEVMARTAVRLNQPNAANAWQQKADALKIAIVKHLGRPDGTLAYFKDRLGNVQNRRDALGTALAVLCGVVQGEAARKVVAHYPITEWGVPLFDSWFKNNGVYHNHTSWPFVTEFFLKALEEATGTGTKAASAALLARTRGRVGRLRGANAPETRALPNALISPSRDNCTAKISSSGRRRLSWTFAAAPG